MRDSVSQLGFRLLAGAAVAAVLMGFAPGVSACTVDAGTEPGWSYPDDSKLIVDSREAIPPAGLAPGVSATFVRYKDGGVLLKLPGKPERWVEMRFVNKLSYNGKVFAVHGTAFFVKGKSRRPMDCQTILAIYDEDGDGRFDTVVNLVSNPEHSEYIPAWVQRKADATPPANE